MFTGSMSQALAGAAFLLLLGAVCVSDVKSRRVPNGLVASLALLGILASTLRQPWFDGLAAALLGIGTGLALWLPFWLLHMLGAGDVKLFAAASAWLGPSLAVEGALLTALYGGLVALAFMLVRRGVPFTVVRLAHAVRSPGILRDEQGSREARLPYALAMTAGVSTAAWFPGILL